MSDLIISAIQSLKLDYELEYAVLNVSNHNLINAQKDFLAFLQERKAQNKISSLESDDINSRVFVQNKIENANSIIVFLFPYLTNSHQFDTNLSVYCMGEDYHIYAKQMLEKISIYIKNIHPQASFYNQVDIGDLNERFFAFYSGVGTLGLNSMIFSKIYGSYVNIGLIVTDLYIEEKIYPKSYCDMCKKCIYSCPGNAINGDFTIDTEKCVSYITQKKGELTDSQKNILKKANKVFGCDKCQSVCHFNINVKTIGKNYDIIKNIDKNDIKDISNKKFKLKYKDRAFSFRGKGVIERNIDILGEDIE